MSFVLGLKCRECGREYPTEPVHVCEFCFGPLEVRYDYDGIKRVLTRELIKSREPNIWRYRELMPIDGEPTIGLHNGFTPLVRALSSPTARLSRIRNCGSRHHKTGVC